MTRSQRQYICLECMVFWFVGELSWRHFVCDGEDAIPIAVCPSCRKQVQYVGTHKGRGNRRLFGERIAHLEFIEATK